MKLLLLVPLILATIMFLGMALDIATDGKWRWMEKTTMMSFAGLMFTVVIGGMWLAVRYLP